MSRFYEKSQIIISEDVSNQPKSIRFQEDLEDTDITNLSKTHSVSDNFIVGTTVVSMGQITQGKFLWVKPKVDLGVSIDGEVINLKGGKSAKLWVTFAAISIVVPNNATNLASPPGCSLFIGG